MFIGTLVPYSQ